MPTEKTLVSTQLLDNKPTGAGLFEEIGDNFSNVGSAIMELVDNALSNVLQNAEEPNINRTVTVMLTREQNGVRIKVLDGGSGIADLNNALRLAGKDGRNSPLNEHGFGLKHALASCNMGITQDWSIQTRTSADAAVNQFR